MLLRCPWPLVTQRQTPYSYCSAARVVDQVKGLRLLAIRTRPGNASKVVGRRSFGKVRMLATRASIAPKPDTGRTHICIFGAGAVGQFLAARLSNTDVAVSLVARENTAAAIQQAGVRVPTKMSTKLLSRDIVAGFDVGHMSWTGFCVGCVVCRQKSPRLCT